MGTPKAKDTKSGGRIIKVLRFSHFAWIFALNGSLIQVPTVRQKTMQLLVMLPVVTFKKASQALSEMH